MKPTLFALSSGRPPAAIAVIRISGSQAVDTLKLLTDQPLPKPRDARLRTLYSPDDGLVLDKALVIYFPGPLTATGEDLVELHLHGGIAVVSAVLKVLASIPGLKPAEAGAFTRRAFENGALDLLQVEGLADLLSAETERQRRQAIAHADGYLSRLAEVWREELLDILAQVEAVLDFSDEDDVGDLNIDQPLNSIVSALTTALDKPSAERVREGIRLVIAGAPNSGKSSLINYLSGREVAIVTDIAGTTRDRIDVHLSINGLAFVATDTAGLRQTDDLIEREGIERALRAIETADIIVSMADDEGEFEPLVTETPMFQVHSKSDDRQHPVGKDKAGIFHLSSRTGEGVEDLTQALVAISEHFVGSGEVLALANERQRNIVTECRNILLEVPYVRHDPVLVAEHIRQALVQIGQLTGRVGVEDMLDALFGRFCIGK